MLKAVAIFMGLHVFVFLISHLTEKQSIKKASKNNNGIEISTSHPAYFSYNKENTLLLGGSNEDNLFQSENYKEELKSLHEIGGNYVRCTMSSRDSGNLFPFKRNKEGLFDLKKLNPVYWNRLDSFLFAAQQLNIVVQVELWGTFDFYGIYWNRNPFNPANNINYSEGRSHLKAEIPSHPTRTENDFFRSTPGQDAIAVVLRYQQAFADRLLKHSLKYNHVLYCIDNETSVSSEWAKFWTNYIWKSAHLIDKQVLITEMWDPWNLKHPFHLESIDNPQLFKFVEISQNNHNSGDNHWQQGITLMQRMQKMNTVRPVTNIKIYGNDLGKHHSTRNAIECFVRNCFMGCASARFHRPESGLGLSVTSKNVIKSMRQASSKISWFDAKSGNHLLEEREENEAYCRAIPGSEYAIYFTNGGRVKLHVANIWKRYQIEWLNIEMNRWEKPAPINVSELTTIKAPDKGHWIAIIKEQ